MKLADGKDRQIKYIAATTYWFNGRQITGQEFMEQLFGDLGSLLTGEDELREIWSNPETRGAFLTKLEEMGYDRQRLDDMRRLIDAPQSDIFDVLAFVRFSLAPLTRAERVESARTTGLGVYQPEMRKFLEYVLQAYQAQGVDELEPRRIGDLLRILYGGTNDAKRALGPVDQIRGAFLGIQRHLFQ